MCMQKLILLMIALFPTFAWAEPSLEFQAEKHDFGKVVQGEQLEYTFEFTNRGTDDLIIEQVNTS